MIVVWFTILVWMILWYILHPLLIRKLRNKIWIFFFFNQLVTINTRLIFETKLQEICIFFVNRKPIRYCNVLDQNRSWIFGYIWVEFIQTSFITHLEIMHILQTHLVSVYKFMQRNWLSFFVWMSINVISSFRKCIRQTNFPFQNNNW